MAMQRKPPKRERSNEQTLAPHTPEGSKAFQSVLDHGFPRFPRPALVNGNEYRVLPFNLTELSSEDLGVELAYWNAMHNYAVEQAVLVRNDLDTQKAKIHSLVDARMSVTEGNTVTDRKAKVKFHPDVILLQENADHLQLVHNLIDGVISNCERNYSTVSREITRRSNHVE